jgi:nicotinate-nucleotide--dimethylbenzimidazole phosphoribosyltransferase
MTPEQFAIALEAGRAAVQRAVEDQTELLVGGEMGIGNTTSATAITAALIRRPALELTGPGTGLNARQMARKAAIIQDGVQAHASVLGKPLDVLRCLGGFEIAALTGFYLAAGQAGIPTLVDGFIAGAAALVAIRLRADIRPWLLFAHRSAEPGHQAILKALRVTPLAAFQMRLGEGSGAAILVPIIRLACDLHTNMATFAEAGITER